MPCRNPFELPDRIDVKLQSAFAFWQSLKRAENGVPFGDDLRISDLAGLPGRLFLLAAFAPVERFRFEFLGAGLDGLAATGKFLDEIRPTTEFGYLGAQASATLEAAAPTFLRLTEMPEHSFSRLLLPMWGNGQIDMLLGALDG